MTQSVLDDPILWTPGPIESTQAGEFMAFVGIKTYAELYEWSITSIADFWQRFFEFSKIIYSGKIDTVVTSDTQLWPRPDWFAGIKLNFAENLLSKNPNDMAIIYYSESGVSTTLTYAQLTDAVAQLSAWMKAQGIQSGDVVSGFLPNCTEAVIGMLAVTALGAVWTSCSPDSGTQFVIDRFKQTNPKLLISANKYVYDSKEFDLVPKITEIAAHLDAKVLVTEDFPAIIGEQYPVPKLEFTRVPFSHPLYILYSSGTTGKPKGIVHSVGGTLIQHIKEHRLQANIRPQERLFYYTTTSWMMWNWLVSGLASGIALVLFDGKPDPEFVWTMVKELKVTAFGTSAPWISL